MENVEIDYKLNWCEESKVNELTVIHYGAKEYIPGNVTPIVNYWKNKPFGGLWTSPENSNASWKEWCDDNQFAEYGDDYFKLKFKPGTKVLLIDSMDDMKELPILMITIGTSEFYFVDYEMLAKKCDALWLTEKGFRKTDIFGHPLNMERWDCESVLIINKECCYQI